MDGTSTSAGAEIDAVALATDHGPEGLLGPAVLHHGRAGCPHPAIAFIEPTFDPVDMARRPHPRLAAAQARAAEAILSSGRAAPRGAGAGEARGPLRGLARLLEAVAQRPGDAGVHVWAGAGAHALLGEPLDKAIVAHNAIARPTS